MSMKMGTELCNAILVTFGSTKNEAALLIDLKKVQGFVWLCESCECPAKEALSMSAPKPDEVWKSLTS